MKAKLLLETLAHDDGGKEQQRDEKRKAQWGWVGREAKTTPVEGKAGANDRRMEGGGKGGGNAGWAQ